MRGLNKVMLIGNLGRDPEVQYVEGSIPLAKITLATTEFYKDKEGTLQTQTEWHKIVFWRGMAELVAKQLRKGSLVYIEGKIHSRTWEDAEGKKKYAVEIVGENFIVLDKKIDTPHTEISPNPTIPE